MCKSVAILFIILSVFEFQVTSLKFIKKDALESFKDRLSLFKMIQESSFIFSVNHYDNSDSDNTVSTFMARNPKKSHLKPESLEYMLFAIKKADHMLITAELHLHRDCYLNCKEYKVCVYQISENNKIVFVNSTTMPKSKNGWFIVDVTKAYQFFSENKKNINFHVVAKEKECNIEHEDIQAEDIGVVGFDGEPQKHPFLVAYFRNEANDIFEKEIFNKILND